MTIKKIRMFAGPNGSGKSSIIEQIKDQVKFGYYINADDIQIQLNQKRFINCIAFLPFTIVQNDWIEFLVNLMNDSRVDKKLAKNVFFEDELIKSEGYIDAYGASVLAEFIRIKLLEGGYSYSFETVMSHYSKVNFIEEANRLGYKTYLYFICTNDPLINLERIKNRVIHGGHEVSEEKIISRYYRSLKLLYNAFVASNRAFIIDNSGPEGNVIVEKNGQEISILTDDIPSWIHKYLIEEIETN